MHCPRCGSRFDEGVRFCRGCGLSLSGVTDLVAINDPAKDKEEVDCDMRSYRGEVAMQGVGLIVFGIVLWLINGGLRSFDLYPASWGKILPLVFLGLGVVRLLYAASGAGGPSAQARWVARREARRQRWAEWEKAANGAETMQFKPELPQPTSTPITNDLFKRDKSSTVPSVTEHTTRQLTPDA